MKWIDFNVWKFEKAYKHYLETLHYSFGANEITQDMKQVFNHDYSIKYTDNYNLIKNRL